MTEIRVIILCKAPVPGAVKTRLIPAVGAGSAANIHARLATETIGDCLALARSHPEVQLELWCSPDTQHAFFHSFPTVSLFNQQGEDLGERMAHALCASSLPAILIGTDCPPVNKAYLQNAIEQLKHKPVVIAPAEDGGYGLIGMQVPSASVFQNIEWSTDKVLTETLSRCEEQELEAFLLPEIWDVDEAKDLDRWLAGDAKS